MKLVYLLGSGDPFDEVFQPVIFVCLNAVLGSNSLAAGAASAKERAAVRGSACRRGVGTPKASFSWCWKGACLSTRRIAGLFAGHQLGSGVCVMTNGEMSKRSEAGRKPSLS